MATSKSRGATSRRTSSRAASGKSKGGDVEVVEEAGGMDLDTVETCSPRVFGRLAIVFHDARDLFRFEGTRHWRIDKLGAVECLGVRGNRGRRNRIDTAGFGPTK